MYESFFGLKCEPFSVAADPHFIYKSPKHRQARAHLMYGLRRGAGFILLTGEIGAGKTTVCRLFLRQLPATADVANVVNPRLDARALLSRICEDLRIDIPAGTLDLIDTIHGHLLLAHAAGRRTLIVVDEAQALSFDVLEQLRLLTNLDATGSKLQVFLIGQPELRTMLQHPVLEPVAQRVVSRFHLSALEEEETALYVAHRLSVAGLEGPVPFDAQSLRAVHRLSGGVPRRINVLCDQTLFAAQSLGTRNVEEALVERVAAEVFDVLPVSPQPDAAVLDHGAMFGHAAALDSGAALELTPGPPVQMPALERRRLRGLVLAGAAGGAVLAGILLAAAWVMGTLPSHGIPGAGRLPAAAAPLPPAGATSASAVPPGASSAAAIPAPAGAPGSGLQPRSAPAFSVPPVAPAAPQAAPLPSHLTALEAVFDAPPKDEQTAWRSLGHLWGAELGPGDPCVVAVRLRLRCYSAAGSLELVRELGRPGILKLTDEDGRLNYALLVHLDQTHARFRSGSGGVDHEVPLPDLAGRWHGEFATLWRPPPGYRVGEPISPGSALTLWLIERMAVIDGPSAPQDAGTLSTRLFAFQLAHGLQPDGRPGPLTLMQVNRASGIAEPGLRDDRNFPPRGQ